MKWSRGEQGSAQHVGLSVQQAAGLRTDSLGEKLALIIRNLPSHEVTLAEIRDLVGQDGLLLLTVFLSIVFLIPVSIPGLSTVFGAAILLIGISRLF
ncbi:MAG TPA: exopolysaccharide biosynthesis protein, partial [Thermoleophilia bacterium]|nr:exopolysaccharide biosynthesis protein [Thermoleophilia bacterium]